MGQENKIDIRGEIKGVGAVTGGVVYQIINNTIYNAQDKKPIELKSLKSQREQEEKLIFSTTAKSKQVYINREVDALLSNWIALKKGCVLFLHGQGGIGKSTLLEKFSRSDRPTIFININKSINMSMVELLLDGYKTSFYNCPKFKAKRDEIIRAKYENKIPYGAEIDLLKAIKEDFGEHGVFIVDTFEKNKNSRVTSSVKFDNKSIEISGIEHNISFSNYIEELVYLFVSNTTFIIAGRNRIDDVNEDRSRRFLNIDEVEEVEMKSFSTADIEQYIKERHLKSPTKEQLTDIETLTHGNPLIISLLVTSVSDYDNKWDEVDYSEMKKIVYEDKDYGLLYYFTQRILSHSKIKNIWKLVIPRVLSQEIEPLLFKKQKVFEKLVDVGLLYRGKGRNRNIYTLHDDVAMAIESYAQKEFDNSKLASWHDHKKVAKTHKRLMEFYQEFEDINGINSAFEGCYHKIMLREGFEKDFEVMRGEFVSFVLGGVFMTYNDKIETCQDIESLSISDIKKMLDEYKSEKEALLSQMSQEFFNVIINHISKGKNSEGIYDISFLKALLRKKKFKKDSGVYYALGIAYDDKEEYDKAIEAYKKAVEINPQREEAYNNMGIAHKNKKEYDKAIEAYKKAVEINPQKDEAYYNNMGNAYGDKKEYDKAIEAYEKAVEINPQREEAYYNMGNSYRNKKEYDKAIEAYKKAVEINPQKDEAYNSMGNAYYSLGQLDEVIKALSLALHINPNNSLAYTNLFELQLTQNQPFDQALEKKYIELFQNQKETFIEYEMLKILQDIVKNQEVDIEGWVQKYRGVELGWSFDELREWINGVRDEGIRCRLEEALGVFEGHGK